MTGQRLRITGMLAYPELNKLITISDDGTLHVSEITTGDQLQLVYPGQKNNSLKSLISLPQRNCFALTDYYGKAFIYSQDPTE